MKRNIRIDSIKYYGILGMCLLHSSYLLSNMNTKLSLYTLLQCGGGICLPLYFFLSAFFFSYNFNPDHTDVKLISRIKSVTIPYFCWNLFFIELYAALSKMQQHTGLTLTHETYFPGDIKEIIRFIWLGYRNPPLWYLQVLMEFVLISPALYALCKKYQKISLFFLFSFILLNLFFYGDIKYASVAYWIPAYGSGLWCGIYIPSCVLKHNTKVKYSLFSCIIFLIYIYILYTFSSRPFINHFKYLGWMLMPILLLEISHLLPANKTMKNIYGAEFLIFCLHYPIIQILDALMDNFFIPVTNVQIFTKWLTVLTLTLFLIHFFYYLNQKFTKPLYIVFIKHFKDHMQ